MGSFKTVSDVKDFFREIRKEQSEIYHLEKMIHELELSLLPKGIAYDRDRVQSSPRDNMSEVAAKAAGYSKELNKTLSKLIGRKKKAEKLLSRLDNPDERTILRIYYMETNNGFLYRWDDVAYHMGYEKRHILRMHGNALNSILKSCH